MTFRTLIRRSLGFHWRSHLGVVLGAAIGSAALIGALIIGDSVRGSLLDSAMTRLGKIDVVLDGKDRFVREDLVKELGEIVVPVLRVSGSVSKSDATARANLVQVLGIDERFDALGKRMNRTGGRSGLLSEFTGDVALLNPALATHLNVGVGDTILLRVGKPTSLAGDAAITPKSDLSVAMRLKVGGVWPDEKPLGQFSLRPGPPPYNIFIPLDYLQEKLSKPDRVNLVLAPGETAEEANSKLAETWQLTDAEVRVTNYISDNTLELRTPRVFLDPPIVGAALEADTNARPVLTYLVNLFQAGTNTTPYSMVTAAGAPWTPADMNDDEIIVSQWLADDLRVKPGDEIALTYFNPESGANLEEQTNTFRVRGIVPMEMPWADRTLMPDFPGIEKAESTSDWDAGFPLVYKIRPKDEDYWKQHRGTPKAFITLAAGQKMWANRFGDVTAIRFAISKDGHSSLTPALSRWERENRSQSSGDAKAGDGSTSTRTFQNAQRPSPLPAGEGQGEGGSNATTGKSQNFHTALESTILSHLQPQELGLRFEPVREQALKAVEQSQDFGGLFLGFSFFVIIAALLLTAMLFQFGLEQRVAEIGTLLALGLTPKQVKRLFLGEAAALAALGGIIGTFGGIAYAQAMLAGLTTIWRDAVGGSLLTFHVTAQTLAIGFISSVIVSVLTIWLTMRKLMRRPARELLVGELQSPKSKVRSRGKWIGIGSFIIAIGLVGWTLSKGNTADAETFFSAGALVLIGGLSFASAWLTGLSHGKTLSHPMGEGRGEGNFTLGSLGIRGCARRRTRSLATVAMLACGSFLIVSIGVFRLDANLDATKRTSGTGGFALIGETTLPVVKDLNSESGRDFFALSARELEGVNFVPFRVHEGDEASCLNLNGAQKPRLLGVKPEMLDGRFSFATGAGWETLINTRLQPGETATSTSENRLDGFSSLSTTNTGLKPGVKEIEIPAIGDANSIQWAMHKKVGDTIDYVDERGQPFKVRIVGAVANSILQGQLIIDEAEFVKRFPGVSGYRTFLIDAPSNSMSQVSATLSRAMRNVGLELTPAAERLNQFNAVQNTYLGTFQVLGGLGLLLGSIGLGIVVLRNVLERRGELAVLQAVGYTKRTLQRLLLIEHGALLATGLGIGVLAAAVAVLPSVLSPTGQLPYQSLALTLAAVLANGALWTWIAARVALRGNLLAALRNE